MLVSVNEVLDAIYRIDLYLYCFEIENFLIIESQRGQFF